VGGDLNQNVFEHNIWTNLPTALWVGKATAWFNNPVKTRFDSAVFYTNTFNRGSVALTGSKAQDVAANNLTGWRAGNLWPGFETSTEDVDQLPGATVKKLNSSPSRIVR